MDIKSIIKNLNVDNLHRSNASLKAKIIIPAQVVSLSTVAAVAMSAAVLGGAKANENINNPIFTSIDTLHSNMEKQLKVVSEKEINTYVNNISKKYRIPKQEVINIMIRLTQYGNFTSFQNLGDKLTELNIGDFYGKSNVSANTALHYISKKKEQFEISGEKEAFVIDNAALKHLESLNEQEKAEFISKVNNGEIVLVNLDGSCIEIDGELKSYTAFDGGQNLEKITEAVIKRKQNGENLETILNGYYVNKVADILGEEVASKIQNVRIAPKNDGTVSNIADNIRPNMPSRNALKATINTYLSKLNYKPEEEKQVRELLVKYVNNMMKMSSTNSFAAVLQKKQAQIAEQVEKFGKTMDDVVYIFPRHGKSYDLIIYMYAKANNIDPSKIIQYDGTTQDIPKEKVMVLMDDVVASGQSIMNGDLGGFIYKQAAKNNPKSNIIFSPITCARKGRDFVNKRIAEEGRSGKDAIIYDESMMTSFKDFLDGLKFEEKQRLIDSLGSLGFDENGLCTGFQYMVPDNCSDFSGYILNHCLNNSSANRTLPNEEVWNEIKTLQEQYDNKVANIYAPNNSNAPAAEDIPLDTSIHSDSYLNDLWTKILENDNTMAIDKSLYELAKISNDVEMTSECQKYKYKDYEILTSTSYYGDKLVNNLNILQDLGVNCSPKVLATIHKGNKVYIITQTDGTKTGGLNLYLVDGPQKVSYEAKMKAFEDMKKITEAGYIDDQNLIPGNWHWAASDENKIIVPCWNKLRKIGPNESKEDILEEYRSIIFKE